MDQTCVAFPVLPGKGEDARRFLREVERERRNDHFVAAGRVGLYRESWYLQRTPLGDQLLGYFASWDLPGALERLGQSREAFHAWFARQLAEVTGVELGDWLSGPRSELLTRYDIQDYAV